MQCTTDGKRICPTCGNEIEDPDIMKCPRCNSLLILKCSECKKCSFFKKL
ncbi:MAG TPA: hypothetical protein VKN64_06980 [Halanaerobiales bacterium]|nr:hypothetical protein [Halanaerobiales bacterium]